MRADMQNQNKRDIRTFCRQLSKANSVSVRATYNVGQVVGREQESTRRDVAYWDGPAAPSA